MGKKFQILEEKGGSLQFRAECEWEEVSVFRVRIESVGGKGIAERSWFSAFEMKLWAEMNDSRNWKGIDFPHFNWNCGQKWKDSWKSRGMDSPHFKWNSQPKSKHSKISSIPHFPHFNSLSPPKSKHSRNSISQGILAFQFTFPAKIKTFEKFNISRNPRISIHFPSQNQNTREIQYLKESSHFNSLSPPKSKHSRNSISQGILAFQFTFPAKIKTPVFPIQNHQLPIFICNPRVFSKIKIFQFQIPFFSKLIHLPSSFILCICRLTLSPPQHSKNHCNSHFTLSTPFASE